MNGETTSGNILIIDDEDVVRFLLCDIIKDLGYSVTDFGNPMKAISFYENNHQSVDLVIFDMTMPELNGRETFFLLKKINRDIKSIVLSGFSPNEDINQVLKDGCLMHLKKPVKIADLKNAVSTVLSHSLNQKKTPHALDNIFQELEIPGSDVEDALKNLDGNTDLYLKMLDKFIVNYKNAGKKINEFFSNNDIENLFVFSHSMKSIAANLGFSTLRTISEAIEKNCQLKEIAKLAENVNSFDIEITSLSERIQSFLNSRKMHLSNSGFCDGSTQEVEITTVLKYLDEMSEMAKKCRPYLINDIFYSKLKNIACSEFGYIEKEELLKKIRQYNFDDLISQIEKIKNRLQGKKS